jgi:hypothetical protein
MVDIYAILGVQRYYNYIHRRPHGFFIVAVAAGSAPLADDCVVSTAGVAVGVAVESMLNHEASAELGATVENCVVPDP